MRIHGKSRSEAILIPVAFITTSNFPWPLLPCTAGGNIIFRGSCYHRRWQYHFLWPLLPPLVAISFSVALVTTAGGNITFCGPYYHRRRCVTEYLDPHDIWTPRPIYFRNIWTPSEIIYPPIKLFIVCM